MTEHEATLVLDCLTSYKKASTILKSDVLLQTGWSRRYRLVQARNRAAERYLKVLNAVWST